MGYTQILKGQPEFPSPLAKQAATSIAEQARLLNRLVSDLLDASRSQTKRRSIDVRPVDVVPVAPRVIQAEQSTTEKHRIVLDAPPHLEGVWDRDRITQALTNLVSNAIKYSQESGAITVTISQTDNEARICASDQGIGLAPQGIPLLFEPYSRVYRERRANGVRG